MKIINIFLFQIFLMTSFFINAVEHDISIKLPFSVSMMRFICFPIRLFVSPFFRLNLPTQKNLKNVKQIKKKKLINIEDFTDINDLYQHYNSIQKIHAKLVRKNISYGIQYDSLTLTEKVFTNRQQELHRHLYSVCYKLAKIHEETKRDRYEQIA